MAAGSWEQISGGGGGGGPATREEASARRTIKLQPMAVRKVRGQRSEERGQGEHGARKGQRLAGGRGRQGGRAWGWPGWAWEARSSNTKCSRCAALDPVAMLQPRGAGHGPAVSPGLQ